MRPVLAAVAFCAVAAQLAAAPLGPAISRLLDSSPAARSSFWGIQVTDAQTGTVLYSRNANRLFVPASNAKLFTLALALMRLGPDFRFTTRVVAESAPDAEGRIRGLRLVGGGDPNLSARAIPYSMGKTSGNPLAPLEDLADQLTARGVKRVEGGITGDDSLYVWEPYADGWAIEDTLSDDGAPVSALSVNDNALTLRITPGAHAGDLAEVNLIPAVEFYSIDNRIRTVAAGGERKIQSDRQPGSRQLRVWGTIPLKDAGQEITVAVDDPAEYAARAFRHVLESRGVVVEGRVAVKHRFRNELADASGTEVELARRVSAPLLEDLRVTGKVSQNLHAELAVRAVGLARQNSGSREAGLRDLKAFLSEIGIDPQQYDFEDGSGLAHLDLVTPAATIQLLQFLYASPSRAAWISLLPVGGIDGTLSARFGDGPAAGRIHAKTGSLSHVSTLSGYAQQRNGRWVAFSIMVNNYTGPAAEVRGVIDRICTLIVR